MRFPVLLEDIIPPNRYGFTIYGRYTCPYTRQAFELIFQKYPNSEYFDLEDYAFGKEELLTALRKCIPDPRLAKHNTVPIIFYKGHFIGGYTELLKKLPEL